MSSNLRCDRLLARVAQQLRGVQLIDGYASAAISNKFHGVFSSGDSNLSFDGVVRQRPVQLCHMPSSKTARLAAFSSALVVIMISVGLTRVAIAERQGSRCRPRSACRIALAQGRHQRLEGLRRQRIELAVAAAPRSMVAASCVASCEAADAGGLVGRKLLHRRGGNLGSAAFAAGLLLPCCVGLQPSPLRPYATT